MGSSDCFDFVEIAVSTKERSANRRFAGECKERSDGIAIVGFAQSRYPAAFRATTTDQQTKKDR